MAFNPVRTGVSGKLVRLGGVPPRHSRVYPFIFKPKKLEFGMQLKCMPNTTIKK